MYNDLFTIGPVTFHTYGLMIGIGIIAAYLLAERLAAQKHVGEVLVDNMFGLVMSCVIFGFIGSKITYILTILPQVLKDPSILSGAIANGWVVLGGLLGGMVGLWVFCKIKKQNVWLYFDIAAPCMAIAQGFGRIGCFFAGCCYGAETDSFCYIEFTRSDFAPNHVHLIPTQLFSSAYDFALFFFLLMHGRNRKRAEGDLMAWYLILYSAGRFVIEFFRGDLERGQVGILSTSQFLSLFTFAGGLIAMYYLYGRRKIRAEYPLTDPEESDTETPDAETPDAETQDAETPDEDQASAPDAENNNAGETENADGTGEPEDGSETDNSSGSFREETVTVISSSDIPEKGEQA